MDLSSPLSRFALGTGQLQAQLRRFWDWWTQELFGLVPEAWRQRLRQSRAMLLIELDGQYCQLSFGSQGNTEQLARVPYADGQEELPAALAEALRGRAARAERVQLRLPAGHGLRKLLSLPVATESALGNVLRFEMDRHTPFASEQVYFGYRVLKREADRKRLQVELQLIPRDYLDPLLQRLAALDVHPQQVVLGEPAEAAGAPLNLLPERRRGGRAGWRQRPLLQWALLLGGLAALLLLPLYQREHTARSLQEELARPQALAEQAATVRDELARLEGGRDFLLGQQGKASEVLLLLDELTRLLPDHTWLTRFELSADKVRLDGESAAASSLIGLLEQSQHLRNVGFVSPVTSNPRTQRERFSLVAERRPQEEPTP